MQRMVSHPPQPHPTYSPSGARPLTETAVSKGVSVAGTRKSDDERPRKTVRHFTTGQLLGREVPVPADSTVSMLKNDGRLKLRIESPGGVGGAAPRADRGAR